MRGVLVNLITNARDAVLTRDAGATIAHAVPSTSPTSSSGLSPVEVTLSSAERRAVIEVSDRGIGIPQERLSRIFEPYFTTKRGGTGLGLAIARNVIDGLGGSISVDSTEGVGTTVRIEFAR